MYLRRHQVAWPDSREAWVQSLLHVHRPVPRSGPTPPHHPPHQGSEMAQAARSAASLAHRQVGHRAQWLLAKGPQRVQGAWMEQAGCAQGSGSAGNCQAKEAVCGTNTRKLGWPLMRHEAPTSEVVWTPRVSPRQGGSLQSPSTQEKAWQKGWSTVPPEPPCLGRPEWTAPQRAAGRGGGREWWAPLGPPPHAT